MNTNNTKCDTWQDILIKNHFDPSIAKNFIGFISWNKGDEFPRLGREITEVLSEHSGKVFAKDALSQAYGDKAIMFFDSDVSEETANKMFDTIMNYEQEEVYNSLET